MVQPFFVGVAGKISGAFLLVVRRLIPAWWMGCFAGFFADFVVQRGGKSW
jgi:hypothetical protein